MTQAWSVCMCHAWNLSEMGGMYFSLISEECYHIAFFWLVYPKLVKRATCLVTTFVLRKYFPFSSKCTPTFILPNCQIPMVSNLFGCSFVRPLWLTRLSLQSRRSTLEKSGPSLHCIKRTGYWAFWTNLKKTCCTCRLHSKCTYKAVKCKEINSVCHETMYTASVCYNVEFVTAQCPLKINY